MRKTLATIALILVAATATGCAGSGGGELAVRGVGENAPRLTGGFKRGIYRFEDANHATVVLLEGDMNNPTQAVTIRVFWSPTPGATPIDPNATNATLQYIIFTPPSPAADKSRPAGMVGIYSGAGFVFPRNELGEGTLDCGVWESNLRLADSTRGFNDLLGQAVARGDFTARRDDAAVGDMLRRLNVLVRDKLGYPRLVSADPAR